MLKDDSWSEKGQEHSKSQDMESHVAVVVF